MVNTAVKAPTGSATIAFVADYPPVVQHWINGQTVPAQSGETLPKFSPATGQVIGQIVRGNKIDAERAIQQAVEHFESWAATNIVERSNILRKATQLVESHSEAIARIVALETGKSLKDARGEVGAAIEMGYFIAGEGRRFYGRTTTSALPNRTAMTVRQPVGPCALIIAANTPIANVAWKAFPALLCGNTAILKASEDTPYTALWFAQILQEAGLPDGLFSVLQGLGEEVGAPLVEDDRIPLVSFTGSVAVGRFIQRTAGERLAKVCLELGGKNPLVVCDDAHLDDAAEVALLSAFSNAGQRCASGSRVIVFDSVYDAFRQRLLEKTRSLTIGDHDSNDYGPVINERQLINMIAAVNQAIEEGAVLLHGGQRMPEATHGQGYYMQPTILENVSPQAAISREELFGPITCLYRVSGFDEALALANDSPMGLTAAIHTRSIHRAQQFQERCRAGVISINGPTYGSEPHMPFGGLRNSGNGFREAGTEVLDVYSDWKTIYTKHDPTQR